MKHYYYDKFYKNNKYDIGDYPYFFSYDKQESRNKHWKKQRKRYGFDDRETWSLDYTFIIWVYERFNMYKDKAGDIVDLDYHKFTIDGIEYTQREIIDKILDICEFIMKADVWITKNYEEKYNELLMLFGKVIHTMWW